MNNPLPYDRLKYNILSWLESLRVQNASYGSYKMSISTGSTLFSSCFAVFLRELYDDLRNITGKQRREWIEKFQTMQDSETGFFIDPRLRSNGLWSCELTGKHDWGYVTWQSTAFCVSALDILGGEMEYPFSFLKRWMDPKKIKSFLDNADWQKGTWSAGNSAMFLGICLITDNAKNRREETERAIDAFFEWHDRFQDPHTGFWGTDKKAPIKIGLFGAIHQYLLYDHVGRSLNCRHKIIDYTLMFQEEDGHFSPIGSGGCEDYDAIYTLVYMYNICDYRKKDIEDALRIAFWANVRTLGDDGGFLWSEIRNYGLRDCLKRIFVQKYRNTRHWVWDFRNTVLRLYNYKMGLGSFPKGWVDTPIPVNECFIFATWLRSLNLAMISEILDTPYTGINWKYLRTPGLGWFRK